MNVSGTTRDAAKGHEIAFGQEGRKLKTKGARVPCKKFTRYSCNFSLRFSSIWLCRQKAAIRVYCNRQERFGMINANKLSHPEIREKVTFSILHFLATLSETHKNIFVWKHYYGWPEPEIASRLGCSPSYVENTLQEINRTVIQRAEAILLESNNLGETSQPKGMFATCG